ncbi:IclR family transcriptional regulator [Pseudonocardia sp. HH130630-07]|uniref:IclR family transcriptional regulator n=1 Tax=Pseudonocardia sp. HH130630-07 TaxID=1690815 RepID=UPI001E32F0E5|nr:helix-turn-helix domain-containing protein [Pseudonocardia sp. HH130630-07]
MLEALVGAPRGLSVTQIAESVGVHRTVAHRLVRTLEEHHLCRRLDDRRVVLGAGLVRLAEPVEQDLRILARPVLEDLAAATEATAHLVVREDEERVRMLMIVEPRRARMHVAFRSGQVDPIDRGSAGLAILAGEPPAEGERAAVGRARQRGFAVSHGEIAAGISGISALVRAGGRSGLSLGLSVFEVEDEEALGRLVIGAAQRLAVALG